MSEQFPIPKRDQPPEAYLYPDERNEIIEKLRTRLREAQKPCSFVSAPGWIDRFLDHVTTRRGQGIQCRKLTIRFSRELILVLSPPFVIYGRPRNQFEIRRSFGGTMLLFEEPPAFVQPRIGSWPGRPGRAEALRV